MFNWIAKDSSDYVSKAIEFSSNIKELSKIRKSLRSVALNSPLCDSKNFSVHFSNMLWEMWSRLDKKNNF